MKTKNIFFTLLLTAILCVPFNTSAQTTIGSGNQPSQWSLLDLDNRERLANDEQPLALHLPRLTTSERNALAAPVSGDERRELERGLMIFNITNNCLEYWNGRQWVSLCESDWCVDGVDINGVCWSLYNLYRYDTFVENLWDRGSYFQWGSRVAWAAPQWPATTATIQRWDVGAAGWTTGTTNWQQIPLTGDPPNPAWNWTEHDPCPAGWQMPTQEQFQGLGAGTWVANFYFEGADRGPGFIFPDDAGTVGVDRIFLPAGGFRQTNGGLFLTPFHYYWSSTPMMSNAVNFSFGGFPANVIHNHRAIATLIRCVRR